LIDDKLTFLISIRSHLRGVDWFVYAATALIR
jgi:hypothetical protein